MSVKSKVPEYRQNKTEHLRQIAQGVNALFDGKVRTNGTITLDASSLTTVITDSFISENSCVVLMPTTASAASALSGTFISVKNGQFTVFHDTSILTDRIFRYVVLGA